jgi:hypothetical protein
MEYSFLLTANEKYGFIHDKVTGSVSNVKRTTETLVSLPLMVGGEESSLVRHSFSILVDSNVL